MAIESLSWGKPASVFGILKERRQKKIAQMNFKDNI